MKAFKLIQKSAIALSVTIFWITLWQIAAMAVDNALLLPSPFAVATRLYELSCTLEFWKFTALSLFRVLIGILLSIPAALLLSAVCSRSQIADKLFAPAVLLMKSTPVVSFILIAIFIVDRTVLPSLITFMMIFPVLYENLREGIAQTSADLLKMAKVFRLSAFTKIKRIYAPAVKPFFFSALCTSVGLAMKAGIAAEVVAYIPDSIGKKLSDAKNFMEPADLLAWTTVIVLLSLVIEFLVRCAVKKAIATKRRLHNDTD